MTDMSPTADDEARAAWAEVYRLRAEVERDTSAVQRAFLEHETTIRQLEGENETLRAENERLSQIAMGRDDVLYEVRDALDRARAVITAYEADLHREVSP